MARRPGDTPMTEALHPDPDKSGTRVRTDAYEAYRRALLKVIPKDRSGVPFMQLGEVVVEHLPEEIRGTTRPLWWVTTVKLDLEARGLIERVPKSSPQRVRRV